MLTPDPRQQSRTERKGTLQELLSHVSKGSNASADTRQAASCLGCIEREFSLVFYDEHDALGRLGQDNYFKLKFGEEKEYFVGNWAVYDPDLQRRVLAELVYRFLFDPVVYNDSIVHAGSAPLSNVFVDQSGTFTKRGGAAGSYLRITQMPTVHELAAALRDQGYFAESNADTELISFVKSILPNKI